MRASMYRLTFQGPFYWPPPRAFSHWRSFLTVTLAICMLAEGEETTCVCLCARSGERQRRGVAAPLDYTRAGVCFDSGVAAGRGREGQDKVLGFDGVMTSMRFARARRCEVEFEFFSRLTSSCVMYLSGRIIFYIGLL